VEKERKGSRPSGVLFKEGNADKLRREDENIRRWETIMPGLPPKVQAFHVDTDSASMLMEYLGGCTFQEVVLTGAPEIAANATFILEQTARQLWTQTRSGKPVRAEFISQLSQRLDDVFRMHPSFRFQEMKLAGKRIPAFEKLVEGVAKLETQFEAPFSVFIHGDFNINNIVYNHEEQRIHYIDLHRSKDTDFVQDVSVFLISNFRLPVLDSLLRTRLDKVMREFLAFSREFAVEAGDTTFEVRLALGMIRSFITSSRFEFNLHFAREMFQRGVYLMRKLMDHKKGGKPWQGFVLPENVLIY
jgi:tRNA A-37 threonylcarbamoyl transferase component Bud32